MKRFAILVKKGGWQYILGWEDDYARALEIAEGHLKYRAANRSRVTVAVLRLSWAGESGEV